MGWKRIITVMVSVCVTPGLATIALAADGDAGGTDKKKPKGAIYLEAAGGTAEANDLNPSISTSASRASNANLSIDENLFGRAAIGWQLNPSERGRFVLRFEGYREDSYQFDAQGVQDDSVVWNVNAEPGGTTSINEDGLEILSPAPDNLQNRVQTYDLFYERRFGGRKTRAFWTAGLRNYQFEGNVPAGAWLNQDFPGIGYTDGGTLRLLTLNQKASGFGMIFSIELQHGFFRDRVVIFGEARSAFVLQQLEVDSGQFFTLVRKARGSTFLTVPASLNEDTSKSSWQPSLEVGLSVKLVEGLHIYFSYLLNSYQDVVLLPVTITIPQNPFQAAQGVSAVYNTHDLQYDGGVFGVTYQW
jgi:hypothetical protein